MQSITFISTVHVEIGKCNSEELFRIIEGISPEVVFLEADDQTYTGYEQFLFSTYGVYHRKLEIAAIQKYGHTTSFEYVTVCEGGLSDAFHRKIKIACQNKGLQNLIDNFKSLEAKHGFLFLNSQECIDLQEEMRGLETMILNSDDLDKEVKADIEAYENSMIRNIYCYSKNNHFSTAIFMCGAAHRKAIIEKMEKSRTEEQLNLTWTVFGS
jgi:hypothetical protein